MDGIVSELLGHDGQAGPARMLLRAFAFSPLHLALLTAIPGGALLLAALMPQRIEGGLGQIGRRPLACWLLGLAILLALGAALVGLFAGGIRPGRWLLAFTILLAAASGIAVSARLLGSRLAAQSGTLAHLLLGLLTVVLCLGSPIGLPVLALLAPLGLGALVLARR